MLLQLQSTRLLRRVRVTVSYRPTMALRKEVARVEHRCCWCNYPITIFCALYALAIGCIWLGPVFCSSRCGKEEARLRERGPVEVSYT